MSLNERQINELIDSSHLSINKYLLSYCGLWPYQSKCDKIFRRIVFFIVISILVSPHVWYIGTKGGGNPAALAPNIGASCFCVGILMKYTTPIIFKSKFDTILVMITKTWSTRAADPYQKAILERHGKLGRMKTLGYTAYCMFAAVGVSQFYTIPVVLDFFFPLNEPRTKLLMLDIEYPFDPFEYYFSYYLGYTIGGISLVVAVFATDSFYIVIVEQCLATFALIKYQLQNITNRPSEQSQHDSIVDVVKLHNYALQYVEIIESIYQMPFVIYLIGTVIFLTAGALSVCFYAVHMYDRVRMLLFVLGGIVHLFFLSCPGQFLINESQDLILSVYTSNWYGLPKRSTTILKIIMLRCQKPCFFTAAGFYVINFENFSAILKTVMSYITVAISFVK